MEVQQTTEIQHQNLDEKKKNSRQQRDEDAIRNLKEMIPDIENIFDIHGRIGNGTFSTVFLGSMKCDASKERKKLFAIKHLIPTSHPNRIVKELKCLVDIGGTDNVAGINLCLRRNESVAFVMPYIPHDRFQDYYDKMSISEIQNYMRNLLIAIRRVHFFNVIHRDIKPSNFLYNRKSGQFMLVDFGLAQSVVRTRSETSIIIDTKHDMKRKNDDLIESPGDSKKIRREMPLKQVNEIISSIPLRQMKMEPALSRNIKSAVLGVTMTNRLQEKVREKQELSTNSLNDSSSISKFTANRPSTSTPKCCCYGKPQICNICLVRKEIPGASRAGTPGYRPPEVLLKYTDQTTAVDMWAVGVIFVSILSGVYPFFKAPDDFVALAEIVMLFGDEAIRKTAYLLGRNVTMSRKCKPLNIQKLCIRLKNRAKLDRSQILKKYQANGKKCEECSNCQQIFFDCLCANTKYKTEPSGEDLYPKSAYDLLSRLLEVNPHNRISAEEALTHEFLTETYE